MIQTDPNSFLGTTVEMDHIDVVPHMDRWPSFHNGVAAGLRIPTGMTTNIRQGRASEAPHSTYS